MGNGRQVGINLGICKSRIVKHGLTSAVTLKHSVHVMLDKGGQSPAKEDQSRLTLVIKCDGDVSAIGYKVWSKGVKGGRTQQVRVKVT